MMSGSTPEPKKWAIATAFEGSIDLPNNERFWVAMNYVQVADDPALTTSWVVQITYECCMIEMPLAVFKIWREQIYKSNLPPGT